MYTYLPDMYTFLLTKVYIFANMYSMSTKRNEIITILKNRGELSVSQLCDALDTDNRTYISKLLSELLGDGSIERRKSGRNVLYKIPTRRVLVEHEFYLKDLQEDLVWTEIIEAGVVKGLSEKAKTILYFAFTEMLNNAIDHSKSAKASIVFWEESGTVAFSVRDKGVGVFRNVMAKYQTDSEPEAIRELIKGHRTTEPRRHSGEGIFWTSKIADYFELSSYDFRLLVDNNLSDYAITKLDKNERIFGTEVIFKIKKRTQKSLLDLFREFSTDPDKRRLDTTAIPVVLYESGDAWISRSQAKRLLTGLEQYQKIILDFTKIKLIGQAFADEVFRVFAHEHPEITLEAIHTNDAVQMMIDWARQYHETK